MKSIFFFVTFFSVSFAMARSTEFGNGGKGLVCHATKEVLFYDSYESEHRYFLTPELKDVDSSICHVPETDGWNILTPCLSKSIELAIKSLEKVRVYDPVFAEELASLLRRFLIDALFVDGDIFPTDDSGIGFTPQGCELKQLAIQHVQQFENDSTYFVSKPLWLQLSVGDKVALLMHEVVYKRALQINPNIYSSEKVRYFSSYILSNSILKKDKYLQIKKALLEE